MNQNSLAFYTEAGTSRGMGHLVRCNTIKEEFRKNNYLIDFYLDSDINFDYKFENLKYFQWNNIKEKNYDIIIIDSYLASLDVYNNLSKRCTLLVCIDDYNRLDYPKSLIINFAPDSKLLFFQEQKVGYNYLLGLDYIPIRQQIQFVKVAKKEQIFIMLGGMDISNLSFKIMNSIKHIDVNKVIVTRDKDIAISLEKFNQTKVLFKPSDDELILNMANSKMAISTASMTLYELNYLQIPTIILAVAENQILGAKQSIKYNIASKYVNIKKPYKQLLISYTNDLINKDHHSSKLIDGLGTKRIIDKTIGLIKK